MKRKNIILLIIAIILIIFTIIYLNKCYPNKNDYLEYLKEKYNEDFIIDEEINDYSSIDTKVLLKGIYNKEIDKQYFKAYRFHLKNNNNYYFIVAYGKFKVETWSIFKTKIFVDNFDKDLKMQDELN